MMMFGMRINYNKEFGLFLPSNMMLKNVHGF